MTRPLRIQYPGALYSLLNRGSYRRDVTLADASVRRVGQDKQSPGRTPARTRWLEANGVRTQFLDAGIGCCWFAEKGDQEPVSGETEEEAIARLARMYALDLWAEE